MRVELDIPEQQLGRFRIDHIEVTEEDAKWGLLRARINGHNRFVPSGTYVRLIDKRFDETVMSNTPDEIRDHMEFVNRAKGSVLINGLGLGVVLKMILEKPEVTEIIVIEKEKDVIDMVSCYYKDLRVTIIHADALEYQPEKNKIFDCVWHDIWPNICSDNWDTMKILHRKYGRRCRWQGSWVRDLVRELYRKDQREMSFRY